MRPSEGHPGETDDACTLRKGGKVRAYHKPAGHDTWHRFFKDHTDPEGLELFPTKITMAGDPEDAQGVLNGILTELGPDFNQRDEAANQAKTDQVTASELKKMTEMFRKHAMTVRGVHGAVARGAHGPGNPTEAV